MPTLLQIDSSPMQVSVSRELTREYAETWKQAHPGGEVIYRDLAAAPPAPIDAEWIGAAYTAPEARGAELERKLAQSEELIGELERADEFVIGVAMHNFSIPSVLKLWIDQIARRGRTFVYGADGPRGLLVGRKATIVMASGGVYAAGTPMAAMNNVEPELRTVLGFLGVSEIRFITAGGTSRLMSGAVDRPAFLKPVMEEVRAAAA